MSEKLSGYIKPDLATMQLRIFNDTNNDYDVKTMVRKGFFYLSLYNHSGKEFPTLPIKLKVSYCLGSPLMDCIELKNIHTVEKKCKVKVVNHSAYPIYFYVFRSSDVESSDTIELIKPNMEEYYRDCECKKVYKVGRNDSKYIDMYQIHPPCSYESANKCL